MKLRVFLLFLLFLVIPLIFLHPEKLNSASITYLIQLEKQYPTITWQIEYLAKESTLGVGMNTAIANLKSYLSGSASADVARALLLVLQADYYKTQDAAESVIKKIDGKNTEWSEIPAFTTDGSGDGYANKSGMDLKKAGAYLNSNNNLYFMIETYDVPEKQQFFDFVIDITGDKDWDYEIMIYQWTNGIMYAQYNDLVNQSNGLTLACDFKVADICEVKVPLSSLALEPTKLKSHLTILPRVVDLNATNFDSGPQITLHKPTINYALEFFSISLKRTATARTTQLH